MRIRIWKREAGEENKRQETNFKDTECCASTVVQQAARQKIMREMLGVTGTLGKANSHFVPLQTGLETAPTC